MSLVQTGNFTHDTEVARSEGVRQSAVGVAAVSQATAKAADIAHYRACLASAKSSSSPACAQAQFVTALIELGTGGA